MTGFYVKVHTNWYNSSVTNTVSYCLWIQKIYDRPTNTVGIGNNDIFYGLVSYSGCSSCSVSGLQESVPDTGTTLTVTETQNNYTFNYTLAKYLRDRYMLNKNSYIYFLDKNGDSMVINFINYQNVTKHNIDDIYELTQGFTTLIPQKKIKKHFLSGKKYYMYISDETFTNIIPTQLYFKLL